MKEHCHLGAVLGGEEFRDSYIRTLVGNWTAMLKNLVSFATSQPQAAYSAFTHGVRHKFTYFMRTMEISDYMLPLDNIITNELIPTLLGCPISPLERELMALPVKYGGLGIPNLKDLAAKEYSTSIIVTQHLVATMKSQSSHQTADNDILRQELKKVLEQRVSEYEEKQKNISSKLDKKTARLMEQISEAGSSNWLSCLPLKRYGFMMNKSEFRDNIRLRYGKDLAGLPSQCACGAKFDVNHALNCHRGGFIIIRHNEVRDFLANMLRSVQNDVETEPHLQNLDGEQFSARSTLTGEQAHPDIRARGFYRAGQQAYFDVKVINPNSESYLNTSTKKVYERAEKGKTSAYNERILNVEHGSFVPLIFSVTGGMGDQAKIFGKLLCNKIAYKKRQNFNDVVNFYRCKLSFLIRRLVLLCIRGSRCIITQNNDITGHEDFEFNCFEAKLN